MIKYNNLPLYEVKFDDAESIFNNIALVTEPAILETFIQLSKQDEVKVQMKINEEQRIVSGPALIPDEPIYRNQGGRQFYIKYTADTIKQMALNFFRTNRQNEGNVEHSFSVNGITFFESYLLNKERGICPKEFEDLPDGTWILSAKVNNDEVWELVKNGTLTGFSISIEGVKLEEEKVIDTLEELMDYLKNN